MNQTTKQTERWFPAKRYGWGWAFLFLVLVISLQDLSCSGIRLDRYPKNGIDVILFAPVQYGNFQDVKSYKTFATELGLISKEVNHGFINQRGAFFDQKGNRKIKVLILPGGEPYRWFEEAMGEGLNCQGVKNIVDFIEAGGSVVALCVCGSSLFATYYERFGPNMEEARRGEWDKIDRLRRNRGYFYRFCALNPFKGTVRGPQETNHPYPKTHFLPIKMNPGNEIVREANLPSTIYQIVTGGGSLIPDPGQNLEVVGWYPNGTVAIGIVSYGKGKIILSNPHPNISGQTGMEWVVDAVYGDNARRWGWTERMITEARELIQTEGDPDGPEPDWALAKAMLSYAYKKASQ